MIIKDITIENFRSYYGTLKFHMTEGLNLIIGSNGDGKTTFYEALFWLFRTDGGQKAELKFASKKLIKEMVDGDTKRVSVSMTYEHNGNTKMLEKCFCIIKQRENVTATNPSFFLYSNMGSEQIAVSGDAFEYDFPKEVKQYSMFMGESDLNVFKSQDALKILLATFSEVKGFDPYISFMEFAKERSQAAADNARKSDRKNAKEAEDLRNKINKQLKDIGNYELELKVKENESAKYSLMLEDIQNSKEASELLVATNRRIKTLEDKKAALRARIKENYTTRLLDDMWILMGFENIANGYIEKTKEFDKKKRNIIKKFNQEQGARNLATKIELGFVPLAVNVPDKATLEELLEDEVCKVCGRPAPKGSDAWNFMKEKLESYLKSLVEEDIADDKDDDDICFVRKYIDELKTMSYSLNDNIGRDITRLNSRIENDIEFNNKRHEDIKAVEAALDDAVEQKNRILAHNDGLSEEELVNAYQNITNMVASKEKADRRIEVLKADIEKETEKLHDFEERLRKISKNSPAETYTNTSIVLKELCTAFHSAKKKNKHDLLSMIENRANGYLEKLNIADFKGQIRIVEPSADTAVAKLVDIDAMEVANPNTALKTTQYMSILFAISQLSVEKQESEFPLIFDAPTSSFTQSKENEFFKVLGTLGKQIIVVTKSFLNDIGNGNSVLDLDRISNVKGSVYRIEKAKPFNDKDLATIRTTLSKIK